MRCTYWQAWMKEDTASCDRMFAKSARELSQTSTFAPDGQIIVYGSKRKASYREKADVLERLNVLINEIRSVTLRDDVNRESVENVSQTAFSNTGRRQYAFYGEKKRELNRLVEMVAAIQDIAKRDTALSVLVGALENHIKNLTKAKQDKASGSTMQERQQIRDDVNALAKKLSERVVIGDGALEGRVDKLVTARKYA
jgi:hypothetical protein